MRSLRWLPVLVFTSLALPSSVGCSSTSEEEVSEDDAALTTAESLQDEVRLLGGSPEEVAQLFRLVDKRIADLEAKKAASKVQAKADVEAYSGNQWARSFFRQDEKEAAIDARASDIFDRPERRALAGAKTQRQLVDELGKLLAAGTAGSLDEPTARAAYIRRGYVEIAIAIQLTDESGFGGQLVARIQHILQKTFPWLGKMFKGMKRDRPAAGLEGEAVNIDRSGPEDQLWKKDPINSTVWHPRSAADITPANLYRGPWFNGTSVPRTPKPGELWKLAGFRSQASDGSHPSIDIINGSDEVKLKFRDQMDVFEEGPNTRIMWALGYDTDPNYVFKEVRVEPRVVVAAAASVERIGLKFGPKDDRTVPGRPPQGLSITVNPIKKAPGGDNITIHFRDGHDETGDIALDSLKRAEDDRPFLDSMEFVTVKRVFGEVDAPNKRDAVGLWDFDGDGQVDTREVRAIGIILGAWLGNSDVKFNNTRLDVERPKNGGEAKYFHALPDVGHLTRNFGFTVDIDPKAGFFHPDMNVSTVRAFDRTTQNDAKWAVAKLASLSEEQIVASVAAGAFNDEALALYAEKLVARRDALVRMFGLEGEFALLRPNGPNQTPPPRRFTGAE
ncbi:MAG: hypothetical protein IPG50_15275 [Myxococcales bacterium]|nr:hypothetical protein [Myxococcales bacterium]